MGECFHQGKDVDSVNAKISDMLVKTIIAIQPSLAHIYTSCHVDDATNSMCFEIFGVDVMLDYQLEPWLIEVCKRSRARLPAVASCPPSRQQTKGTIAESGI